MSERDGVDAALAAYLRTYNEVELVQGAADADVDPQLATIAMSLATEIDGSEEGVVIDVGSGEGALLQRLSARLLEATGWRYLPVDVEQRVDAIAPLARRLQLRQRIDPTTIEEFDAQPVVLPGRKLYVCRNVLHELRLDEAARLVTSVGRDFGEGDVLLIQDLLRLPRSERHHHCWIATLLEQAIRAVGFSRVTLDVQRSRSGNQWFNLRAAGLNGAPSFDTIRGRLLEARREQWDLWARLTQPGDNLPRRPGPIDEVDLDLQFASLTRELLDEGLSVRLDTVTQRRLRVNELVGRIEGLADGATPRGASAQQPTHFRERGQQLTHAEDFLRSTSRLAMVHGGPGTGKTTFIEQVLATRLYDKTLVRVDLRSARGVWPVLERMLSQLGLNLAAEVMGALDDLAYDQVKAAVGRLLNAFAKRMVFVFENVDEALNSNQRFSDPQTGELLAQIARKEGVKVILTSRREYVPPELAGTAGNAAPTSIRVGRFGSDDTVVNVLDDYFDRASAGIEEYPSSLIEAIDKHPLVASLAGRILASEGRSVLRDESFFREMKRRLHQQLAARLVDDASRPAVEAASELRVPVPAVVIERLSSRESVHHARTNDVLYSTLDRNRIELLQSLGLFRKRMGITAAPTTEEIERRDGVDHAAIADEYLDVYRRDDDPTWIRESHFHRMLAGGLDGMRSGGSTYYRTELVASAHYCFDRKRDFRAALELYEAAARIQPLDEGAEMWRASSLIRTRQYDEGDAAYARLVLQFPDASRIKSSHVDALLSMDKYEAARGKLLGYDLKASQSDWYAQQWGRVELGLHNYESAIAIFAKLRARNPDDPYAVTYLARGLQQFGDLAGAIDVLVEGHAAMPTNVSIATSLGANLERDRQDESAYDLLLPLFKADPGNARAALALVRILVRRKDLHEAKRVVVLCSKADVQKSMRPFRHMAQAELLMAQGDHAGAAEYIKEHLADDETSGLLVEALLGAADRADDEQERESYRRQAAAVQVPPRLRQNVPVQIDRAGHAVRLGDRAAFDDAVAALERTRVDPSILEAIRASFDDGSAPP